MIGTLLRIGFISLRRDRVAQAMTFILPVAFFSIFALVFGNQGRDAMSRVPVAVVDEDQSEISGRLAAALARDSALKVVVRARRAGTRDTVRFAVDRARAQALVRDGDVPVAVILPKGLGERLGRFDVAPAEVEVFTDPSDPIASQMLAGLLQKSVMTALPGLQARRGIDAFERYGGPLTPAQRELVARWMSGSGDSAGAPRGASSELITMRRTEVVGQRRNNGLVAFYAAGIAVMFLLFSASAAGGSLLEEMESGTLERVLGTRVGMTGLLIGKWLFVTLMGMLQITVMFVWGMLVFKLDLLSHLPGFFVMTAITAAAAAGFGLVFATACRTRAQLSSIATIVILCSSAVGGSMFPRFLMSEGMQKLGLVTFNAWALDGYIKVFWRDARIVELLPQVGMLLAFGTAFLVTARLLARRWEAA
jgi:ABC-2 type transport system permease protein